MITQIKCGKCKRALKFDMSKLGEGLNYLKCSNCGSLNRIVRAVNSSTKENMVKSFPKEK